MKVKTEIERIKEEMARTLDISGQVKGMFLADAEQMFPEVRIRPVKVDGKDLIVTQELRNDRINVTVKDGIIASIISLE
jgi:hypothetical protein